VPKINGPWFWRKFMVDKSAANGVVGGVVWWWGGDSSKNVVRERRHLQDDGRRGRVPHGEKRARDDVVVAIKGTRQNVSPESRSICRPA